MLNFIIWTFNFFLVILFVQFIYYMISSFFKESGNSFLRMMYWIVGEEPPVNLRKDKNSHQEL